jgi:hypothetical protein
MIRTLSLVLAGGLGAAAIAARDASEANGKLVEKVDSVMLTASDYSPMK